MKFLVRKYILLGIILTFSYFLILFSTMSDYGMNWDEPLHFSRGFAYLHYFLTGKKDFSGLSQDKPHVGNPGYPNIKKALQEYEEKQKKLTSNLKASGYQYEGWTPEYFLKNDSGHPPLSDILAAATNYVFYRKLGVMDDLNSYHLFEILTGGLMLFVVYIFSARYYGIFAGIVSSLSLFLYPLFFGEVHFNIKDPPEAAFYTLTIFAFFEGIIRRKWKWILASSISCGFALGTKFNIVFLPFIISPWFVAYVWGKFKFSKLIAFAKKNKTFLFHLVFYPFIVFAIFFSTWPYLWQDPFKNLLSVVLYYKGIGTGAIYQSGYLLFGWNTYAIQWIFYTTPPIVIFLSTIGIISSISLFKKEEKKTSFLFLIWFIFPILRVSVPGSSIYGGDRQIMEFLPAMALLSGLGALMLKNFIVKIIVQSKIFAKSRLYVINVSVMIFVIMLFMQAGLNIISLHPNENVYFNSFIGGLKGAKERNISGWGNSYGNAYLQGVDWMNSNAPQDAKLALISATLGNIPRPRLRTDISLYNNHWSGTARKGEYLMDMISQGWPLQGYQYEYLETFLNPVYDKKVDGVTIFKIWKNDAEHAKEGFLNEDSNVDIVSAGRDENNGLKIIVKNNILLTKLDLFYDNSECDLLKEGTVHISEDGIIWQRQADNVPILQVTTDIEPKDKRLVYFFAAKPAKFILIYPDSKNSCIFNVEKVIISKLSDITP
ncbi:MAG: glycosyltransferase family 39 protein [Candidatus Levybacteria bacterium]|nr:glycosyltransferase family 39 protein [Candidatus Levybacteria bacterium]